MAIISSIKYSNISNEYNEGANYFRRFLQYAENVSTGNMQIARTILDGLVVNKSASIASLSSNIVLKEIKAQIQKLGYEVAEQVGQSDFKCSIAVKLHAGDEAYTLSILLDDDKHYDNSNLVEQYYQRPAILQSFGWRTMHVFAKDWLQQPEKIMDQIVKRIKELPLEDAPAEETPDESLFITTATTEVGETENIPNSTVPAQVLPGFEDVQFERFVFTDASSNKFWEAGVQENKLIVRYGRVGTKGQVQVKTFDDAEKAIKEKDKMIREKTGKGYK
jgi:predicted DNA-binding WGR domain protein